MTLLRILGFLWGIGGILALLLSPIIRLSSITAEAFALGLSGGQLALTVVWIGFMVYAEGHRGFARAFAPRVAARAQHLLTATPIRPLHLLLAPAFCMALFHAPRRRVIVMWILTLSIVGLVVLVSALEQPWRGIIDAGVVAGLSYGTGALLFFTFRAVRGTGAPLQPELPELSAT